VVARGNDVGGSILAAESAQLLAAIDSIVAVIAIVLAVGARWVTAHSQKPPSVTSTRVRIMPGQAKPALPPLTGHVMSLEIKFPKVDEHKLNTSTRPGLIEVDAQIDLKNESQDYSPTYIWRLTVLREDARWPRDEVTRLDYEDKPFTSKPGTEMSYELHQLVPVPPGVYTVRASIVEHHWVDGVEGWQLVPDEGAPVTSSYMVVVK
jgi:hypothetical protein